MGAALFDQVGGYAELYALAVARGRYQLDCVMRMVDSRNHPLMLQYRRAWSNDREAATFRHGREN